MTSKILLDNTLWQECDNFYHQQQANFLMLQDEYGVNVNLLLLALWLDQKQQGLSDENWQYLASELEVWEQKLLHPYRRLRKLSKYNLADTEYQQMLEVELMLERKSQALILHKLNQLTLAPQASGSQGENTRLYLSLFGVDSGHYPSPI
ncbi:TIGR02444 family protein [Shewanella sp. AS1]|uniref:TIGR02444 family protein n=1 Tax=Shewanella sp. AS1 TaxID=2907626 RepID=UPI001F32B6C2|nr:TIGR02444 family protein [Shewanella sp. AS1]MCE9677642.1 TIGR02444 family protein [Shewanella sp. AS1]